MKRGEQKNANIDSVFNRLRQDEKARVVNAALADVQQATSDLDFKRMITDDADYVIRQHQLEGIGKFTLALSCLIFFSSVRHLELLFEKVAWDSQWSSLCWSSSSILFLITQDSVWRVVVCGPFGLADSFRRLYLLH